MAVFVISSLNPNPELAAAVAEEYGERSQAFGLSTFYIHTSESIQALSDTVGIKRKAKDGTVTGTFASVVISELSPNYWGFAPSTLWNWMKAAFEASA